MRPGACIFARPRGGSALAFRREPFDSRQPGTSHENTHILVMKQHITTLAILFLTLLNLTQTRAQTAASAQTKLNVTRDLPYADPADPRQKVDIYAPEGAKNLPVVFWIHGGGWETGDKSDVQVKPQAFADKGFVFVSTGYRLLPNVDMGTIFRDIAKSVRWVHDHIAEHGGDPRRRAKASRTFSSSTSPTIPTRAHRQNGSRPC